MADDVESLHHENIRIQHTGLWSSSIIKLREDIKQVWSLDEESAAEKLTLLF